MHVLKPQTNHAATEFYQLLWFWSPVQLKEWKDTLEGDTKNLKKANNKTLNLLFKWNRWVVIEFDLLFKTD